MKLIFTTIVLLLCVSLKAQLLTWTPEFIQESSSPIEITVDAIKGNQGLKDYTPISDVHIHIGAITTLSTSSSDWKYAKFAWATTAAASQAIYLGNNKWKYTITGGLRAYFGITNPAERVVKIALLFRSGSGARVQRNIDGSDMYIPVYEAGLEVRLSEPLREPKYISTAELITKTVGEQIAVSAKSSLAADLKLFFNGTQLATAANAQQITASPTITTAGNQTIIAEAVSGAVTKRDTITFFVSSGTNVAPLPAGAKDGINYEPGDTSVILVLHAPGKNRISVLGDFNNWVETAQHQMNKTPDGSRFWIRLTGLTPTTEYGYQFIIDGTIKVADYNTEKILDPFNDPFISATTYPGLKPYPTGKTGGMVSVLQTRQPVYNWAVNNFIQTDKRKLVIYELLLRDFLANHDWKTLKDTLSYLKRLGVNAIQVMPFNEFEGNSSWGYNGFQYFAPDKYYGPKNSIKEFIDSCHKNGIAVIMDIVLNHTYGPSPLARMYWDAANNRPAADNPWYNPVQPHAFGFGEDFNHESAATKSFFNRVLLHWVTEYKIDGYRVDFSKGLTQKVSTNDGNFSAYDPSRVAIINNYYNTVKAVSPNAYFILEHFADNTEERILTDSGMLVWSNVWTQYQEAAMGYLPNSNFQNGVHTSRGFTNANLVTFMESHDEERITFKSIKYGNSSGGYNIKDTTTALKRMELNAAFFLTIPGPKMIWEFGELGYDYSRCYLSTNGEGGDCDKKLDPKPIRWDYQNKPNRKAVFDVYAKLIKLRNTPNFTPTFVSSDITHSLSGAFKWIKVNSDSLKLLVVGNFDVVPTTGSVTFQNAGMWYNYMTGGTRTASGAVENLTLQPGEYAVYTNRDANNLIVTSVRNAGNIINNMRVSIYPNPVNKVATLEYDLPESGKVNIYIVDVMGRQIATLFSGFKPRGSQRLIIKPADFGASQHSNTYLLKIEVNGKSKVHQFIVQH